MLSAEFAFALEPVVEESRSCGNDFELLEGQVFVALSLVVGVDLLEGLVENLREGYTEEKSWVGTLTAKINPGETTFYSFANIKPEDVEIDSKIDYSTTDTPLPTGFDSKLYSVKGNVLTAADFPKGIPMSNKQTIEIKKTTADLNLEVIRMVE